MAIKTIAIFHKTIPIRLTANPHTFLILMTMATRVLIIGRHQLFHDGLIHLLSEREDLEVVASVQSWDKARELMLQEQPDVLIVDHETTELHEKDLSPLLENVDRDIKVIYLTLAQNKMIIHKRQQVADVTADDLLDAVQTSISKGALS
jgi:DNA-binding NarL/FixJ family response regulator